MTDKELAQEVVVHGNHKAFAEIVHRHSAMVFSKALGVMHTEERAAEVTQQTFVRAYENLAAWRGTQLAPWLAAIAAHTALKLLDKERRRRTTSLDSLPAGALGDSVDASSPCSEEHEARLQQMEAAIAQLPEQDRQLLHLHYYDQRRTADIARLTGLTQSNVLVRLHRIRERLKKAMTHERND